MSNANTFNIFKTFSVAPTSGSHQVRFSVNKLKAVQDSTSENASEPQKTMTASRKARIEKKRLERESKKVENVEAEYPEWARVMEESARNDPEVREILGDSIGNPEEMEKRIKEKLFQKGEHWINPLTGSSQKMEIVFHEFSDPFDVLIWLELHGKPDEKALSILGGVFSSWFVLGNLGAFQATKLQLTFSDPDASLSYDDELNEENLPACLHNIGDLEFQDNIGRIRVDLGTSDMMALDILINALTQVSSQHVGVKQVIFGAKKFGDWEEGMTRPEDGYLCYKL